MEFIFLDIMGCSLCEINDMSCCILVSCFLGLVVSPEDEIR